MGILCSYLHQRGAMSEQTAIAYQCIVRDAQQSGQPILPILKELVASFVRTNTISTVLDREGLRCYAN